MLETNAIEGFKQELDKLSGVDVEVRYNPSPAITNCEQMSFHIRGENKTKITINYIPSGIKVRFYDCEVAFKARQVDFARLEFLNCKVKGLNAMRCDVLFESLDVEDTELRSCTTNIGGTVTSAKISRTRIALGTLFASQRILLLLAKNKALSPSVRLPLATATFSEFGTYEGNVHYLAYSDTIIAGCWHGKLHEFLPKCEEQGVDMEEARLIFELFSIRKKKAVIGGLT